MYFFNFSGFCSFWSEKFGYEDYTVLDVVIYLRLRDAITRVILKALGYTRTRTRTHICYCNHTLVVRLSVFFTHWQRTHILLTAKITFVVEIRVELSVEYTGHNHPRAYKHVCVTLIVPNIVSRHRSATEIMRFVSTT